MARGFFNAREISPKSALLHEQLRKLLKMGR